MSKSPAREWIKVDKQFFRKHTGYNLKWEISDLSSYIVSAASCGGAIALAPRDSVYRFFETQSARPAVRIYSNTGEIIQTIIWNHGTIKGIGWTRQDHLGVLTEDGIVRIYNDFLGNFYQFSLELSSDNSQILDCEFWDDGLVARLSNNKFVCISKIEDQRSKIFSGDFEGKKIYCWKTLPPTISLSRGLEILVAVEDTIYLLDSVSCQDQMLNQGPFSNISLSSSGDAISLLNNNNLNYIVSIDFRKKFSTQSLKRTDKPSFYTWCGDNAVVISWEDEVSLLGKTGGVLSLFYDSNVVLIQEPDGCRIFSSEKVDFIEKVSTAAEKIFKLGSTAPSAVLLDCVEKLEKKSPKADENIRIIKDNLIEAIDECIEAASYELDIFWQKRLLKAASFGKSVLDLYIADEFVEACQTLRVLNAVRDSDIGLFITYAQYLRLTPERLINRLILRNLYFLAIKVSNYIHLIPDKIYIHWACQVAKTSQESDEATCARIVAKLKSKKGISYEYVAKIAYEEGRPKLASYLLDYEPRAGYQVPLLLSMDEGEKALIKAIESENPDLIAYVTLHLYHELPLAKFFKIISNKPLACNFVQILGDIEDKELLKDFYYQADRRADGAFILFSEAMKYDEVDIRIEKVKVAQAMLSEVKEYSNEAKLMEESIRLLKLQNALEKDYEKKFIGLSVTETISKLLSISQVSKALSVKSEFKISDKQFCWLRLKALVQRRSWEDLLKFADSKKSPIGYVPFYKECIAAGNTQYAAQFIPKCTKLSAEERIDMWITVGKYEEAGLEAFRAKNIDKLQFILTKVTGSTAVEFEGMLRQLGG